MAVVIDSKSLGYRELNCRLREADGDITVSGCCGQRFIAAGMSDKKITINGVPGNALGAYLNGAEITVNANAQDAVGDTMNAGKIVVHGGIGDAAGYAMRGGRIFIKGDAGYRAILLCGDPGYYTKVGFTAAEHFGIRTAENRYFAALHACQLYPDALKNAAGRYFEDAIYDVDETAAMKFDADFPPKERLAGTPSQQRFAEVLSMQKDYCHKPQV